MQQQAPSATLKKFINQCTGLRLLKKLGTTISLLPPKNTDNISILVFSDAGRYYDRGQICYVAGILFGKFQKESTFHLLSWSSHREKNPFRSIGAVETLAAGEAIYEGRVLAQTLSLILNQIIELVIALDTKDLFTSLSTKRNSIDTSISADENVISFEFECGNVREMIWIHGRQNLADPGTKENSRLVYSLQLLQFTGKPPMQLMEKNSLLTTSRLDNWFAQEM